MSDPMIDTRILRELFRTASVWRGAVIGGAVFTVLAVLFPPSSPPHPRSTYTPPAPARATAPGAGGPQAPPISTGTAPAAAPPLAAAPAPANAAPAAPVAPAVPKILPSAQADIVPDDKQSSSRFGEVKEGEEKDNKRIKPEQ